MNSLNHRQFPSMRDGKSTTLIIANFGGPRSLDEVKPFLISLFSDPEVFRVPPILRPLFKTIARKRSRVVVEDYAAIGGKSPIYEDTEYVAARLSERFGCDALTFHRYLPATHKSFFKRVESLDAERLLVFPLFPQFTYATTGSIAALFQQKLSKQARRKLRWIRSYPEHPSFTHLIQTMIQEYLSHHQLEEEETILLFSAHGLPQSFVDQGDVYQEECEASFRSVSKAFPKALSRLSYQSKVGRAVWLTPATDKLLEGLSSWAGGRKHLLFIPISFTSDHVETLFEIEDAYMPLVREAGLNAHRLPAPNRRADWIDSIVEIIQSEAWLNNSMLVRCPCDG